MKEQLNLSALTDRELLRYVEGRKGLTPLEQELLRRIRADWEAKYPLPARTKRR